MLEEIRFMVQYINKIHKAIGEETFKFVEEEYFYFIKKGDEKIPTIDFINYYDRVNELIG